VGLPVPLRGTGEGWRRFGSIPHDRERGRRGTKGERRRVDGSSAVAEQEIGHGLTGVGFTGGTMPLC
jgi:hypothetical protein